jgi:AcrR family transcriptional regulator
MPRSGDQARERLQQAALDLYREHGYDKTTTAQIAARAGVTERTFFRHFPDKREVLFGGETPLRADLQRGVVEAPDGLDPLATLMVAFGTALPLLRRNRPFAEPRYAVISTSPALRERELAKEAALIEVLAETLRRRGVDARRAELAAQIGMAAFGQAILAWFDDPAQDLEFHLAHAFDELRALTAPTNNAVR